MSFNNLEKEVLRLLQSFPYYAHVLMQMERKWDSDCPSAAVCQDRNKLYMVVNPEWFNALSEETRVSVLHHELLHVTLDHLTRGKELHAQNTLGNIAADLVVNQMVKITEELKEFAVLPERFSVPPHLTFPQYVRLLKDKATESKDVEVTLSNDLQSQDRQERNSHGYKPEGFVEVPELKREILKRVLEQAGKRAGRIPSEAEELLARLNTPSRIPWQQYLKTFIGNAKRVVRSSSRFKPNRRLNNEWPGAKYNNANVVIAAIDTSGSMSKSDLEYCFSELFGIVRKELEILVVECDTRIQGEPYIASSVTDLKLEVHGRGGTEFNPIFELATQRKIRDVVYFTDLEGYVDEKYGALIRTLWVVPKHAQERQMPFGRTICIKDFE